MACSICGKANHKRTTCPDRPRTRAVNLGGAGWIRIDVRGNATGNDLAFLLGVHIELTAREARGIAERAIAAHATTLSRGEPPR